MQQITTSRLKCGATLIAEPLAGVQSASMSLFFSCGNAFDAADRLGISAMLSELLLRGAGDLDSRAQADAFDRLGASRSASAGREYLRLSATMLGSRLSDVIPLIGSCVREPRFDDAMLEPVRALCLQSLASLRDDPQERAVLAARARHFVAPYERSGYGDEDGLRAISRDDVVRAWSRGAVPASSVIAVAGAIEPSEVASALDSALTDWSGEAPTFSLGENAPRGYAHERDETNQVQIVVVHDAPAEPDRDSMKERLLTAVLSGGMSGRLFSEVREKRGLCYAVSASYRAERTFGAVSAYVGTTPERAQEALDVLVAELNRAAGGGARIEKDEFERAVAGLKSRLVFSGESTSARSRSLAGDYLTRGRARTLAEVAAEVDAVSLDDLNAYAAGRSLGRLTIQTLGPSPLTPPA